MAMVVEDQGGSARTHAGTSALTAIKVGPGRHSVTLCNALSRSSGPMRFAVEFLRRRPRGGLTSETSPGLSGEARRNPAAGIGFGGLTAGAQRVADVARHISRISPTST